MKRNKLVVEIPEKLSSDAFQPYSIIPNGEWINMGTAKIAAKDIKDPELSKLIPAILPKIDFTLDKPPFPAEAVAKLNTILNQVNAEGYTLSRKQRFEVVDQYGVPAGHEDEMETDVYLGVQYDLNHFHRSVDVLGLNLGVVKLSESKMSINALPMFKDMDLTQVPYHSSFASKEADKQEETAETEVETSFAPTDLVRNDRALDHNNHANNGRRLQENTQIGITNAQLIKELHGQPMRFVMKGGETGARYVVYQLVDQISITRNFAIEGISSTVYEGEFRHAVFTARYPYEC